MNEILIVEDDTTLSYGIEYTLKNEGFKVKTAKSLQAARAALIQDKFDLILLDVKLPDGTGYDFCQEVRRTSEVAVIFLTACDEEVNIVLGLDMGADDYITKPFRIRELISRIKAVLRRNSKQIENSNVLASGSLKVYTLQGKVMKDNVELSVTALEYRLLLTFMQHPRQVLTRTAILAGLWDVGGEFVDDNTLSVYIRRLREKIESNPASPKYITTVRGMGYKWDCDVRMGE